MNRNDYLSESVLATLNSIRNRAHNSHSEDRDVYDEDDWRQSLSSHGLDEEEGNRWDEHRNAYLAGCLANSAERSGDRFSENSELLERNVDIYLGRHDRASAVFSREYEDDEGEVIHNHVLIDHMRDNNHLEGVQRMATAYFNFTNAVETEE